MTTMPRTQPAHPAARTAPDAGAGAGARSGGYLLAIVINALLLYVVQHLVAWDVRFITPAWNDVLWAVDLSLQATIVANVLFLIYDARCSTAWCKWSQPGSPYSRSGGCTRSFRSTSARSE
jgi:hypothetical protein